MIQTTYSEENIIRKTPRTLKKDKENDNNTVTLTGWRKGTTDKKSMILRVKVFVFFPSFLVL